MYAVIFKAKLKGSIDHYTRVAARMREIALSMYGCLDFSSVTNEGDEIAISYWENEDQIKG